MKYEIKDNKIKIGNKFYGTLFLKIIKSIWLFLAIIASLIGLISFAVGGFIFLIFGIISFIFYKNYNDMYKELVNFKKTDKDNKEDINIITNNDNTDINKSNSKIRKSTRTFAFFDDDNRYLKYAYYDVDVKGIEYRDFDISKIEINHQLYFDTEPDNQYDSNAIKILYDDFFIGYIPKNNLQSMMSDYGFSKEKEVCGMTYLVDEETKKIQIALAFYDEINNRVEYLDTKLTKTTKKDEFESRQDNLAMADEGEEVELEYDYENETYIVTTSGLEIGEINKSNSKKLQDYEDEGLEFKAGILEINENDSGNLECKIRIIVR